MRTWALRRTIAVYALLALLGTLAHPLVHHAHEAELSYLPDGAEVHAGTCSHGAPDAEQAVHTACGICAQLQARLATGTVSAKVEDQPERRFVSAVERPADAAACASISSRGPPHATS